MTVVAHDGPPSDSVEPSRGGRPKVLDGTIRRFSVVGDDGTVEDLETVRGLSRLRSVSEIFRVALQVYALLLQETRHGATVTIVSRDGKTRRDIVFA